MQNSIINLYHAGKVVQVPVGIEQTYVVAKVNWIREISRPYFLIGVGYCDQYPFDEGYNVFVAALDKEVGLEVVCRAEELEDTMN